MVDLPGSIKPVSRSFDRAAYACIAIAVALLFLGAPRGGDFYWSDAPRHALNGVFIKDLIAAFPWRDPAAFAYDYYTRYPALTILFYPPLFYVLSAPFYAMLGVSHETALFVVFLHYVAYAWGCYRLALFVVPRFLALAFALTMSFVPEIAFWGRQVMLEVPALAFLVWSAVAFVAHLRSGRPVHLYAAAAALVLAVYTKLSVVFLALPMAVALLVLSGMQVARNRHAWLAFALSGLSLIPLAVMTIKFGQANVQSVSGIPDAEVSRATLNGWLWYARQWPSQLGWPLFSAAVLAIVLSLLTVFRSSRAGSAGERGSATAKAEAAFWWSWLAIGYLYFSAIDLKEVRHSVFLLPPMVLLTLVALHRWMPRQSFIVLVSFALAAGTAAVTLFQRPVYYVHGYADAADYVARHAPKGSVVMFSGYRDGSFTFNMRARDDRPDLSVYRADKLLLSVAVRREIGVKQKELSEEVIAERINQLGIHYVVAQPAFWADLEVMRRLENVLRGPQFEVVSRVETPANHKAHESELVIYRNLGEVAKGPIDLRIDLPIIGREVSGSTNSSR